MNPGYTRQHPCFARRKGCEKKAEAIMETSCLCLAMCRQHAEEWRAYGDITITELPAEPQDTP